MAKLPIVENDPVVFFSEGAPSQNLLCRVHGVPLGVTFAGPPLLCSISWRYVA
jgi:hypothetical protein